jgi:hypothetical protein
MPMILLFIYAAAVAGLLWYTVSYLPFSELTDNVSFSLNIIQLGLLSLLSFLVYRQEKVFRSIFFQFWLLFAVLAVSAPLVYHVMFWHGRASAVITYTLILVLTHALFAWTVANILFTYMLRDRKRWVVDLLSAMVVLPVVMWIFWPYYWSPELVLIHNSAFSEVNIYAPVQKMSIIVNVISLVMLLAFFLHKYRTDRPIGAYADTLLFLFSIYCAIDTFEMVSQVTSIELMNMTQWANVVLLLGMAISLLLRLKYKSQRISEYYESQCLSVDPRIDRRIGHFDRIILWCFFDPQKTRARIFLGPSSKQVSVKPTSRIPKTMKKIND